MAVRSAEEAKLKDSFDQLAAKLREAEHQPRLMRPLAYWVQRSDRRLPLAFLDRSVGEIVHTPFLALVASAGIGPKKMQCLVKLLKRVVTHEEPANASLPSTETATAAEVPATTARATLLFDPEQLSELDWEHWRKTVKLLGLEQEKLGRVAPSLARLPSVIWHTPLSFYLDQSLAQLRQLKTYGIKRVAAVAEVFHAIHVMFQDLRPNLHYSIRLAPRFVESLESWAATVLREQRVISLEELSREFLAPLLEQIEKDAGEFVASLARARLDVEPDSFNVRRISLNRGVTRARIYQMLDECRQIMDVRWPEGRELVQSLRDHQSRVEPEGSSGKLLARLQDLCYPEMAEVKLG